MCNIKETHTIPLDYWIELRITKINIMAPSQSLIDDIF